MDEANYMGLAYPGFSRTPNDTIALLIEDYVNHNYDAFSDLVYRYGLSEDEINVLIKRVLNNEPIKNLKFYFFKSKV